MIHPGSQSEFIQSQKTSDPYLCIRKWRAGGWPGKMIQRGQPTSMSQSPLNPFRPQIAGSQLVLLEWARKGAQEAAGRQWKDQGSGVRRPEFQSWPPKLMATPGRSFRLLGSHLVPPFVNRADNITLQDHHDTGKEDIESSEQEMIPDYFLPA